MAHYTKKDRDPITIAEDKRRAQLAAVIHWLRKNCEFERINGALHACLIARSTVQLFGTGGGARGEMMSLNVALPIIMKKINGGGGYHQLNDIMKACHILADDLEREEMTRRREARQRSRG
jgi:hypothetical protein